MEWIEVFDDISRWIDSDRMSNCSLKGHQQKVINIHCWIRVLVPSEASCNPLESVPKPSALFCSIWCWCYMLSFMWDWYSLNISLIEISIFHQIAHFLCFWGSLTVGSEILHRNISSGSSGRVRGGGRETWNLCGRLWRPSFLWPIFTGPGGGAWPPRPPPGSATEYCSREKKFWDGWWFRRYKS